MRTIATSAAGPLPPGQTVRVRLRAHSVAEFLQLPLTSLDLSYSGLSGPLPAQLFTHTWKSIGAYLRSTLTLAYAIAALEGNQLTGTLPTEFAPLLQPGPNGLLFLGSNLWTHPTFPTEFLAIQNLDRLYVPRYGLNERPLPIQRHSKHQLEWRDTAEQLQRLGDIQRDVRLRSRLLTKSICVERSSTVTSQDRFLRTQRRYPCALPSVLSAH